MSDDPEGLEREAASLLRTAELLRIGVAAISRLEAQVAALRARERSIIDHTWGYACGDGSVPSTKIQDKIIEAVGQNP